MHGPNLISPIVYMRGDLEGAAHPWALRPNQEGGPREGAVEQAGGAGRAHWIWEAAGDGGPWRGSGGALG